MVSEEGLSHSRPEEIDIFKNRFATTLIYRYFLASHHCKNKKVLDVGCGCGYGMGILKTFDADVIGMDIQKHDIKYAEKHGHEVIERDITKDLKKDPLENQFDVVLSIETIEHIPRHEGEIVLNNMRKWVKPGGMIIIITPNRHTHFFRFDEGSHLYEYSYEELMALTQLSIQGEYNTIGIDEIMIGDQFQACSFITSHVSKAKSICAIIKNVVK